MSELNIDCGANGDGRNGEEFGHHLKLPMPIGKFLWILSHNPEFATGRISASNGKDVYKNLWVQLAVQLNSVGLGEKSVEKWQKSWSDFKCALKRKAAEIRRSQQITGGGPQLDKKLSIIETKILSILGETFYKGCNIEERGLSFLKTDETKIENEAKGEKRPYTMMEDASSSTATNDHNYICTSTSTPSSSKRSKTAEEDPIEMYNKTVTVLEDIKNILCNGLADVTAAINNLASAIAKDGNNGK